MGEFTKTSTLKNSFIYKMKNKPIWLRTSLFVEKNQWAYVLRNGIKSFIEQPSIDTITEALMIEFNYMSGENIRFAIKVPGQNAEMLAYEIDAFFKSLFTKSNLPSKDIELPVQGLFLPFPGNTIQYGLYNGLFPVDNAITKIISKTSAYIIEALMDETINDETLIMLAFYFHCALITQAKEIKQHDFTNIYITEIYPSDVTVITEDFLVQKYEENKINLMEVEESIRNYQSTESDDNPFWLGEWMMACKEVITSQYEENDDLFIAIVKSINKQLGLTSNMQKLVHHFISCTYGVGLK